jgi:hypothetical protein
VDGAVRGGCAPRTVTARFDGASRLARRECGCAIQARALVAQWLARSHRVLRLMLWGFHSHISSHLWYSRATPRTICLASFPPVGCLLLSRAVAKPAAAEPN